MPKQLGTLNLSREQGIGKKPGERAGESSTGKYQWKPHSQRWIPKQAQITSNLITELSAERTRTTMQESSEFIWLFSHQKKKLNSYELPTLC